MYRSLAVAACLAALSTSASATPAHVLTYAEFEESVPHFDLDQCPASMALPKAFCRVSFNSDAVHVFVFSEEGEQPMVGFRSFDQDGFSLQLK